VIGNEEKLLRKIKAEETDHDLHESDDIDPDELSEQQRAQRRTLATRAPPSSVRRKTAALKKEAEVKLGEKKKVEDAKSTALASLGTLQKRNKSWGQIRTMVTPRLSTNLEILKS